MFKIILSTLVLVTVIGLSTSTGILGKEGAQGVGNVFGSTTGVATSVLGAVAGEIIDGPSAIGKGAQAGQDIADKLGDNIAASGDDGTGKQLGAIVGSTLGVALAAVTGGVASLTGSSGDEAIAIANDGSDIGPKIGKVLGEVLDNI